MSFIQKYKEKRFEKSQSNIEEQRNELKKNLKNGNPELLRKFTGFKSLITAMAGQLILGAILGLVEYELIGFTYTAASIAIYAPIIYLYSRSLRRKNGVFLMIPSSNFLDWDRIFVSNEIWDLVEKETGLTLHEGKMNGTVTYLCTKVEYLPGTNIPQKVKIAWAHYNRLTYAMFAPVLDELTETVEDALLDVAKLEKMKRVEGISQGIKQTKENIDMIMSAYRDESTEFINKFKTEEEGAKMYEENIKELLTNPEFLRAFAKRVEEKNKKEEEE